MLFQDEKILILHPGKCGGTTVEHLFLRSLRDTVLVELLNQSCFSTHNNKNLTADCLSQRVNFMVGVIDRKYEVNGVSGIYLQHADIQASIKIHGKPYVDSLYKIAFIRNPFARILSAFYYNMWDRKTTFEDFVLNHLVKQFHRNKEYSVSHFGEINKYTHYQGKQYVDFLGRLENIIADVEKLSRMTNIPLNLKIEHKHAKTVSSDIYEHYSEAYSDEMVDFVSKLYQKDFELFGYTFEREVPFQPKGLTVSP